MTRSTSTPKQDYPNPLPVAEGLTRAAPSCTRRMICHLICICFLICLTHLPPPWPESCLEWFYPLANPSQGGVDGDLNLLQIGLRQISLLQIGLLLLSLPSLT